MQYKFLRDVGSRMRLRICIVAGCTLRETVAQIMRRNQKWKKKMSRQVPDRLWQLNVHSIYG